MRFDYCQKNEPFTGVYDAPGLLVGALKFFSFVIFWIIIPFIPLILSMQNDLVFGIVLVCYTLFFVLINRAMHYHWKEIIVFIFFFWFCAFWGKSLVDYEVVEPVGVIQNALLVSGLE